MTTNARGTDVQAVSATIYQFPARGRMASATNQDSGEARAPRLARVMSESAWYHDEAIEAERAAPN